ncbi:unnamed protein product [Thlaspi arvense]|uniref:Uncharacterized protein n=1 Tax=Thlaspi arvense TaxID=13288 RepID=A0AAU9SK95_THLAR|nr:unnamed protein product [Thlaspi arvense]
MGALAEMEKEEKAKAVIETVSQKPGRRIQCRWIDPNSTEYEKAKKAKRLVLKHTAEASFVTKKQLEDAEKLKIEIIDKLINTDVAQKLKIEIIDKLINIGVAKCS